MRLSTKRIVKFLVALKEKIVLRLKEFLTLSVNAVKADAKFLANKILRPIASFMVHISRDMYEGFTPSHRALFILLGVITVLYLLG
jgi:hypothetical protein